MEGMEEAIGFVTAQKAIKDSCFKLNQNLIKLRENQAIVYQSLFAQVQTLDGQALVNAAKASSDACGQLAAQAAQQAAQAAHSAQAAGSAADIAMTTQPLLEAIQQQSATQQQILMRLEAIENKQAECCIIA
jgi:hypothetical protein